MGAPGSWGPGSETRGERTKQRVPVTTPAHAPGEQREGTLQGPPGGGETGSVQQGASASELHPGEGLPRRGSSAIPHPGSWHPPTPNKRLQPNLLGANDLGTAGTQASALGLSEWGALVGGRARGTGRGGQVPRDRQGRANLAPMWVA